MPESEFLVTVASPLQKARSVNQTSGSFVAKIPTILEPFGDANNATGASVFDLANTRAKPGIASQNLVKIIPYAIGSNNQLMDMRVIGWHQVIDPTLGTAGLLWVPTLLCDVIGTLSSTYPGIAGQAVLNTELFCDTLTLTFGDPNSNIVNSPTTDAGIGYVICDLKGAQKLEMTFTPGGSSTSCNALWSMY